MGDRAPLLRGSKASIEYPGAPAFHGTPYMRRLLLPSAIALVGVVANAALSTSWGASLRLPPGLADLLRIASLAAAAIPGSYALARAEKRYEQGEQARVRREALDGHR